MSADLGLVDYEFWHGDLSGNGLDFGLNSNVDVMKVEGLTDQNALVSDRQHHNQFGDIPGVYLARSRLIVFELDVRKGALSDTAWRDLIDDVEGEFTIVKDINELEDGSQLHWQVPGNPERFLRARCVKRKRIMEPDSELGLTRIAVQLRASDPRFYTAAPNTDLANTGTFTVTNNGKQRAYPRILFERALGGTSVKITNNDTGVVFEVTGLGGTVDLTADMDQLVRGATGLVVFRATTNDYPDWIQPRTPFYLRPGTNSITLQAGDDVGFTWWDTFV